jgi:phosphonatase-like hydrolase
MHIELVVFDIAGTTVEDDDAVNRCLLGALAAAGLAVDPATVNEVMGLPKPAAIRRLIDASPGGAALGEQVDAINADFVDRMERYYTQAAGVREIPGASATFAFLRRGGIKTALISGFSRHIVEVLLKRLAWSGEQSPVDAVVASDEVSRGRPHPDMIHRLMRQLGVGDGTRVAKVGDTPVDLEEGANAGCGLNIGVATGAFPLARLESLPHTHLLGSVADFPDLFRSLQVVGF